MGAPGCDNAPVIKIGRSEGARSRYVTIINPYYENPQWLRHQVNHWLHMKLSGYFSFVIVDDGSPRYPAWNVLSCLSKFFKNGQLRLFRIEKDVRWNWLAARNIGWHHVDTMWAVATDIDHVIPEETAEALVYGDFDQSIIYRFSRHEHTGAAIHPHPNSWLMTRTMYWRVGGYDEALSGYYGTDGEYRRRCAATAPIRILTDHLVRHEHVGDSSTVNYKRKQPEDAAVKKLVRARPKMWKPKVLSFPYREVGL